MLLRLGIWTHRESNSDSWQWWRHNSFYNWSYGSRTCTPNRRIMQHNHWGLGFAFLAIANTRLSLRPWPPRNASNRKSFILGSLAQRLILLYLGFKGFHYLILFAPFLRNFFTMDNPTIKVSKPLRKAYFLPCCPCWNSRMFGIKHRLGGTSFLGGPITTLSHSRLATKSTKVFITFRQ